ncbi:MAG: LON peptidase substrate-binding domain-containing protein [Cyclobacteriaceae bacterium]
MEYFLPLFPLKLVAFPGEQLNLHIFEDRYKQLIDECIREEIRFGIPAYLDQRIEFGTEMSVEKVIKTYPDGQMDIITLAHRVFRVTDFANPAPGKLYAGGEVLFLDNIYDDLDKKERLHMLSLARELFETLNFSGEVKVNPDATVFDLAHKLGLSAQKQYQLLQLERESDRQLFVIEHLEKTIPVIQEMELAKERIQMNGHFRKFDPLDF